MSKADELLTAAAKHMRDRAATYDNPEGERSMGATVAAYRSVTGGDRMSCERDGWLLMALLKLVRFYQNPSKPHRDSVEDAVAYAALFGESALAALDHLRPPLTIVVGGRYKRRDGSIVEIKGRSDHKHFPFVCDRLSPYAPSGMFCEVGEHPFDLIERVESTPPMSIEVGGRYKRRDGETALIVEHDGGDDTFRCVDDLWYASDGVCIHGVGEHPFDLIERVS